MLQKLLLNAFFFYFPLLEVTSCSAPRPLQWCIVVSCCKHPRLEAVPAPAFSQMFAAPGYAWTTAEGEAVKNSYVHLCLSSSVSADRDELPPCELSWLVGVISWDLIWNGDPKLVHALLKAQLFAALCYKLQDWASLEWQVLVNFCSYHELFIALSMVCFTSFCGDKLLSMLSNT